MVNFFFYLFAFFILVFALLTINSRNPVHAVLSLIMVFFNCGALFIMIGAEFIAASLIIVYVGAVAVLFLFVVMMMDIKIENLSKTMLRNIPVIILCSTIIIIDLVIINYQSYNHSLETNLFNIPQFNNPVNNTMQIGQVLYTKYILAFQGAGIILLIAMIGAILLTLRSRENVKRQNISEQISRKENETIKLVEVKNNVGVAIDD
jgi:NADH-quinone oxidoreductase subunit J